MRALWMGESDEYNCKAGYSDESNMPNMDNATVSDHGFPARPSGGCPAPTLGFLPIVRPPHLLFVFSDQHRWCHLGCYGNGEVHTPHFDAFAASGVQIGKCVSDSPLCVTARGSLQVYHLGGETWRGVRTSRYNMARKAAEAEWLLFDNESDPWQMRNLIVDPEHAALAAGLGRQLDAFTARHDRLLPADEFIRRFELEGAWNLSQQHFNLPQLHAA